ncbi:MAG: hypothetical protein ACFFC7_16450 [Candidatus Hermodarchaeota archaeon]
MEQQPQRFAQDIKATWAHRGLFIDQGQEGSFLGFVKVQQLPVRPDDLAEQAREFQGRVETCPGLVVESKLLPPMANLLSPPEFRSTEHHCLLSSIQPPFLQRDASENLKETRPRLTTHCLKASNFAEEEDKITVPLLQADGKRQTPLEKEDLVSTGIPLPLLYTHLNTQWRKSLFLLFKASNSCK